MFPIFQKLIRYKTKLDPSPQQWGFFNTYLRHTADINYFIIIFEQLAVCKVHYSDCEPSILWWWYTLNWDWGL